jgi:hypothetical protein
LNGFCYSTANHQPESNIDFKRDKHCRASPFLFLVFPMKKIKVPA